LVGEARADSRYNASMRRSALVLLLCLTVLPSVPAPAQSLEDGLAAYRNRDWPAAAKALRPLAEAGVAVAEERMGRLYQRGRGVPKDYAQALAWYRKAVDQGEPFAEGHLGGMYMMGQGVPQSDQEAARLFRLASQQGNPVAQTGLGYMSLEGRGTKADAVEAANWFREAAEQGNAAAMLGLAGLYEKGDGVARNYIIAHKWYQLASLDDGENEADVFERAARSTLELEKKMSASDIEAAQRIARAWKRPAER